MKNFLLFLICIFTITGCVKLQNIKPHQTLFNEDKLNPSYYIKNDKIMYYCMKFFNSCSEGEIKGANISSFQILEKGRNFAKDKNNVYHE